jgi:hypothetical protein
MLYRLLKLPARLRARTTSLEPPDMKNETPVSTPKTPVARADEATLDDPGNEDPGSLLDAPAPLRPSSGTQREQDPRPGDGKPR